MGLAVGGAAAGLAGFHCHWIGSAQCVLLRPTVQPASLRAVGVGHHFLCVLAVRQGGLPPVFSASTLAADGQGFASGFLGGAGFRRS